MLRAEGHFAWTSHEARTQDGGWFGRAGGAALPGVASPDVPKRAALHRCTRRRRRRSSGRKPAFTGDFPDGDRDITEIFDHAVERHLDCCGGWSGASATGLPDPDPGPAAAYRRAIAQANTEARLLPAPPHQPYPDPWAAPQQPAPPPPAPRDTGPMQRLPRITRVQARPRPGRAPDAAIFIWSALLAKHIMLCGVCLRSRYADPIAATMPFAFESLRQSARASGWRLDTFTRWACPACQQTPAYHSPRPVIQWDPDAINAAMAGDGQAEFRHRAAAEWDLITAAAAAANHGKHAAVTP